VIRIGIFFPFLPNILNFGSRQAHAELIGKNGAEQSTTVRLATSPVQKGVHFTHIFWDMPLRISYLGLWGGGGGGCQEFQQAF
jgi:hypothetical protein